MPRWRSARCKPRRSHFSAEKALGSEHPQVAIFRKSLGSLLVYRGRYDEGEPLLSGAGGALRRADPPVPRELAACLNSIAQLRVSQGQFETAEQSLKQALSLHEGSNGPDHPSTLIVVGSLASLLVRMGQLDRAEPLLRRVVQIGEKNLGTNHPATVRAIGDLGALYGQTGKLTLAESLLTRALHLAEDRMPEVEQIMLNQLAMVYFRQRRFEDAIPLIYRGSRIALNTPVASLERATGSFYLARIYAAQGKVAQAELSFQEAIALFEEHWPGSPPLLHVLREYLAVMRRDRKAEVRGLEGKIKALTAGPVR